MMNPVVNSQGTESRRKIGELKSLYINILLNPSQTAISNEKNEKFSTYSSLNSVKGSSLNFVLDAGYFFSKMIGISSGVTYGSYSTKLSMDSCSIKYSTTDEDLENYEMRIKGKSINEDQKISFLRIPICLDLRIPAGNRLGFFLKGGVGFEIPIAKTFNESGTFSYSGYYPAYNVTVENISNYGFPSNLKTDTSSNLQIKALNLSMIASGGMFLSLTSNVQLVLGAYYNKSMANISAYKEDPNFRLTSKANVLNSIMAGSKSAGVQAFGLSFGIRYFLK